MKLSLDLIPIAEKKNSYVAIFPMIYMLLMMIYVLQYINKVGTVHRITERGDVRVQYEGCSNRWTFHSGALSKVQQYSVGDIVEISDNVQKVKDLQKGHGEWTENMKNVSKACHSYIPFIFESKLYKQVH